MSDRDDETTKALGRRGFLKGTLASAGALALGGRARKAVAAPDDGPKIPLRRLGKTDAMVSRLIAGTALPLSLPYLKRAFDLGVTGFDLADCYNGGNSEQVFGQFLERTKLRDKIFLISKSCPHDVSTATATLDTSLERMKTDHLDLFFLHNLTDPDRLDAEMKQTAERLKKQGKIKAFGFSCHAPRLIENLKRAAKVGFVDAILFKYNFRDYDNDRLNRAIDACKKADIGLIAMKTQGAHLSFAQRVQPFRAKGLTQHQAVLKAVWEDQRIDLVVSAMKGFGQLAQNTAAAQERTKLGSADLDRLRRFADDTKHLYCRGCEHHCVPALERPVAVADTVRLLTYHDEYGEQDKARRLFSQLPAATRQLGDMDFAPAQAACPYGVDVPAIMRRAQDVLVV